MLLKDILKQKNITIYKLSKKSGVPYSTLNEIVNEKAKLNKCSAETVYHIASALDVSMEDLLKPYMQKRMDFENFKSEVCHRVKDLGDIQFMIDILEGKDIRSYYECGWYRESFYLLAMVDYLSRLNNIPLCNNYADIRCRKLEKTIFPRGVIVYAEVTKDKSVYQKALDEAIPEFKRFNIIESEIRNVA